ncbi:MAG: transglycosylase SLT domain-containing protein [Myxococcota bacterium]|nr:transglycosylase SLT domain-containing protein [Myxococcota bacterium]
MDPAIHNKLRRRRGKVVLLAIMSCAFLSGSSSSLVSVPSAASLPSVSAAPEQLATASALEQVLALANPSLSRAERSRIVAAIDRYSAQYELDPDLVMAIVLVESNARPWARSPKGAVGLMQVMPHMMRPMGLAGNLATVESNIEAGCFILANNIERLGVERGISAYFWGSRIRGVAYLEKVLEARARVRELRTS